MPRSAPRTKIAAVGTLAALGALAAVATASNPAGRRHAPAPAPVARVAPPKTIVVHRTVGVLTKLVPARAPASANPKDKATTRKAVAVATPAAVTPTAPKTSQKPGVEPTTGSSGDDTADLPEPGVTEDECLPVTVGGAPEGTTAGAPAGVAVASSSRADRRAARRARRRAERRARRRHAQKSVRGGRPLRTSHPLPEDVPGGVVDGCGLATVPTQAEAPSTAAVGP